jgi:hypothetical protein
VRAAAGSLAVPGKQEGLFLERTRFWVWRALLAATGGYWGGWAPRPWDDSGPPRLRPAPLRLAGPPGLGGILDGRALEENEEERILLPRNRVVWGVVQEGGKVPSTALSSQGDRVFYGATSALEGWGKPASL